MMKLKWRLINSLYTVRVETMGVMGLKILYWNMSRKGRMLFAPTILIQKRVIRSNFPLFEPFIWLLTHLSFILFGLLFLFLISTKQLK